MHIQVRRIEDRTNEPLKFKYYSEIDYDIALCAFLFNSRHAFSTFLEQ